MKIKNTQIKIYEAPKANNENVQPQTMKLLQTITNNEAEKTYLKNKYKRYE